MPCQRRFGFSPRQGVARQPDCPAGGRVSSGRPRSVSAGGRGKTADHREVVWCEIAHCSNSVDNSYNAYFSGCSHSTFRDCRMPRLVLLGRPRIELAHDVDDRLWRPRSQLRRWLRDLQRIERCGAGFAMRDVDAVPDRPHLLSTVREITVRFPRGVSFQLAVGGGTASWKLTPLISRTVLTTCSARMTPQSTWSRAVTGPRRSRPSSWPASAPTNNLFSGNKVDWQSPLSWGRNLDLPLPKVQTFEDLQTRTGLADGRAESRQVRPLAGWLPSPGASRRRNCACRLRSKTGEGVGASVSVRQPSEKDALSRN